MHRFFSCLIAAVIGSSSLTASVVSQVFTLNDNSDSITVIDALTNAVTQTILLPVTSSARSVAITPDGQHLWVGAADSMFIYYLPTSQLINTINLPTGARVAGMAFTSDERYAYVTDFTGYVLVVDMLLNRVIGRIQLPANANPIAIDILPNDTYAYVADFEINNSAVYVIDIATNRVVSPTITLPISGNVYDISAPDSDYVYLTSSNNSNLYTIATATNTVVNTLDLGDDCGGLDVSPNGDFVYVATNNSGASNVSIVETAGMTIVDVIQIAPTNTAPQDLVVTPDGKYVYVSEYGLDRVAVVDLNAGAVVGYIPVGDSPVGITCTPLLPPGSFYATNKTDNFGIAKIHYNNLTWNASQSVINGYSVKRNGVVIATLPSTATSYQDLDGQPSDIYTISTFNDAGASSFILTSPVAAQ